MSDHVTDAMILEGTGDAFGPLLSRVEAAKVFAVHPDTISRWAKTGLLNPIKLPSGTYRFRKDEIDEVLATFPIGERPGGIAR